MVKRMNRYDELVNWLQNEHNEVFNQWEKIEEVMRLEEAQKLMKESMFRWEKEKEHLTAQYDFLKEKGEHYIKEDILKPVLMAFNLLFEAAKNQDYDRIEAYKNGIRAILMGSSVPSERYLKDGRRLITPFNSCWNHNHKNDVKYEPNTEYEWRDEEE